MPPRRSTRHGTQSSDRIRPRLTTISGLPTTGLRRFTMQLNRRTRFTTKLDAGRESVSEGMGVGYQVSEMPDTKEDDATFAVDILDFVVSTICVTWEAVVLNRYLDKEHDLNPSCEEVFFSTHWTVALTIFFYICKCCMLSAIGFDAMMCLTMCMCSGGAVQAGQIGFLIWGMFQIHSSDEQEGTHCSDLMFCAWWTYAGLILLRVVAFAASIVPVIIVAYQEGELGEEMMAMATLRRPMNTVYEMLDFSNDGGDGSDADSRDFASPSASQEDVHVPPKRENTGDRERNPNHVRFRSIQEDSRERAENSDDAFAHGSIKEEEDEDEADEEQAKECVSAMGATASTASFAQDLPAPPIETQAFGMVEAPLRLPLPLPGELVEEAHDECIMCSQAVATGSRDSSMGSKSPGVRTLTRDDFVEKRCKRGSVWAGKINTRCSVDEDDEEELEDLEIQRVQDLQDQEEEEEEEELYRPDASADRGSSDVDVDIGDDDDNGRKEELIDVKELGAPLLRRRESDAMKDDLSDLVRDAL